MGKHETSSARVERDHYPTPGWVIDALAQHFPLRGLTVREPACGEGRMVEALKAAGADVYATDIVVGYAHQNGVADFLSAPVPDDLPRCDWIVTNPPFGPR